LTPNDLINPHYRAVIENTFKADGSLDAGLFVSKLTADATFQLGGNPRLTGRETIRLMLVETFRALLSVEHRLVKAYELPDVLIYEAVVVYTYRDGQRAEVPYANFLDFDGELVKNYRIYLDR
jgi:hypothetical protein